MGVSPDKEGAVGALCFSVFTDGLGDGHDVIFGKTSVERGASMTGGAKGDLLCGITMNAANTALSNRLYTLEADPVTQTYVDGINTALDGRLDTLEADPTTQTLLDAVQADVDQNEADADAAIALKLNTADPAATGDLTVDTNAKLEFDSNITKLHNVLRGTSINIGNNIEIRPAAPGGRVEVTGGFHIDITEVPEASFLTKMPLYQHDQHNP